MLSMKTIVPLAATMTVLYSMVTAPLARAEVPVDVQIQAGMPKLVGLSATAAAPKGPVQISLDLLYTPAGRLACAPASSVDGTEVTCRGGAARTGAGTVYKLIVTGTGTALRISGTFGTGIADIKYSGPKGKARTPAKAVSLIVINPVTTEINLSVAVNGTAIQGSGTIDSGFGNDDEDSIAGALTGRIQGDAISWSLVQGNRKAAFKGVKQGDGYLGTLKLVAPPVKGAFASFHVPSFTIPALTPVTFLGNVSTSSDGGSMPTPAAGATVTAHSDAGGPSTPAGEAASVTVNADGSYRLMFVPLPGRPVIVEAALDGYTAPVKLYPSVAPGATIESDVLLEPLEELTVGGATARSADGQLAIEGLPSGVASIAGRVFSPASDAGQYPGDFTDDQGNILVCSVFTFIQAKDASGLPLHALGGGTTLRMLVPKEMWGTIEDLHPDNGTIDVPLYHFDESDGRWKRGLSDGTLMDGTGAPLAESQLGSIRDGSYVGPIFAGGRIDHVSCWSVSWPSQARTCMSGIVRDDSGQPVAGALVLLIGVGDRRTRVVSLTGADGSFCANVPRSEEPGEDLDGDGTTGETRSVRIEVAKDGKLYRFGPLEVPSSQASCQTAAVGTGGTGQDTGGCLDVGLLDLVPANEVSAQLCTIHGQVVFSGNTILGTAPAGFQSGTPIAGARVRAFDQSAAVESVRCFLDHTCTFTTQADETGNFTLTIPVLDGPRISAFEITTSDDRELAFFAGTGSATGCPADGVIVQADFYDIRLLAVGLLDASVRPTGSCAAISSDARCVLFVSRSAYEGSQSGIPNPPSTVGPWLSMDLSPPAGEAGSPSGMLAVSVSTLGPQLAGSWTASVNGQDLAGSWVELPIATSGGVDSTPLERLRELLELLKIAPETSPPLPSP